MEIAGKSLKTATWARHVAGDNYCLSET